MRLDTAVIAAYLGPAGTYSEEAARAYFGESAPLLPCANLEEALHALDDGSARFAVLPVENSSEGSITRTVDLICRPGTRITGEVVRPVEHMLLRARAGVDGLRSVHAHPQALAQCRGWLSRLGDGIVQVPEASNAAAAVRAIDDPTMSAIASARAASLHRLEIVARGIQDEPGNRTRFLVLGGPRPAATGFDRTSLALSLANTAGALVSALAPFARRGLSVLHIEPRPLRCKAGWEYRFYLEVEGHEAQERVAEAIADASVAARELVSLGSYRRAE